MKTIFTTPLLIAGFMATAIMASAQVSVSPVSIYMSNRNNVGNLYIRNGNDHAREVEIDFKFGYPSSDRAGNPVMVYNDTLLASKYKLTKYIRIFPRRFNVPPGGQQTVRLQMLPLTHKPAGVYWTRLVVKSRIQEQDIELISSGDGIGTQINYVFHQSLPVFFRKGTVHTSIHVARLHTQWKKDGLLIKARLNKSGNAPWNGSVTATLRDEKEKIIARNRQTVVAYRDIYRRLFLMRPNKPIPSGKYKLELLWETRRKDVSPKNLVQSQTLKNTFFIQKSNDEITIKQTGKKP